MIECLERAAPRVRLDAPSFCPAPSQLTLLAVLGIFTTENHALQRLEIRGSWWHASSMHMLTRFVLFGQGLAGDAVLHESSAHADIVYLRGVAGKSCREEPLRKLLAWLECALTAWPHAQLIGKGDDDAWIHLRGVEKHLAVSMRLASSMQHGAGNGTTLLWGMMESFAWNHRTHRPVAHSFLWNYGDRRSCKRSNETIGPFACVIAVSALILSRV